MLRAAAGEIATRYCDLARQPVAYPGRRPSARRLAPAAAGRDGHRDCRWAREGLAYLAVARAHLLHVLVTDRATATAALELARAAA
jgi:hypothetical protein